MRVVARHRHSRRPSSEIARLLPMVAVPVSLHASALLHERSLVANVSFPFLNWLASPFWPFTPSVSTVDRQHLDRSTSQALHTMATTLFMITLLFSSATADFLVRPPQAFVGKTRKTRVDAVNATRPYSLVSSAEGKTFFDTWNFEQYPNGEPTHGSVRVKPQRTS